MNKNAITLTVIANMTSNYGEGLGNISSVQKVYRNQKSYATRSRESLKNAICVQSGLYDDLQTSIDGAMQKLVDKDGVNAATCRALEGGYMSTKDLTYIRNSSFYLTDAVSPNPFINDTRFHNNLYLATNYANAKGLNVQNNAKDVGLMPYQYEYDKSLKIYSMTIALDEVGVDKNFDAEADNEEKCSSRKMKILLKKQYAEAPNEEKCSRVLALLDAVENLSLVVKGNLDNAEPVFVVGGLSPRKTHYFENAVTMDNNKLHIEPIKQKLGGDFKCGLLKNGEIANEDDIVRELAPLSVPEFFDKLREQVKSYYSA